MPTPIITSANIMPTQFVPPTQSGTTNDGHNIQYLTVSVDQLPFLRINEFEAGGSVHRGPAGGTFRGRGRRGRGGRGFTRNQGEFDAYSMDVAPINIFENQVIPMGLHNLSKSFKPNLATTRVFSLGTKFIPVWKKVVIKKPFSKFEDFRRKMSNKVFFEETTPGTFVRNKNFHIKTGFWTDEIYNDIDTFCYNIRDGIANLIDGQIKRFKQNLCKQEAPKNDR